jgi:hypothetical protein
LIDWENCEKAIKRLLFLRQLWLAKHASRQWGGESRRGEKNQIGTKQSRKHIGDERARQQGAIGVEVSMRKQHQNITPHRTKPFLVASP